MKGFEPEDTCETDASLRIVISAPDKNMPLERADIAFMLVQYEEKEDDFRWVASISKTDQINTVFCLNVFQMKFGNGVRPEAQVTRNSV